MIALAGGYWPRAVLVGRAGRYAAMHSTQIAAAVKTSAPTTKR